MSTPILTYDVDRIDTPADVEMSVMENLVFLTTGEIPCGTTRGAPGRHIRPRLTLVEVRASMLPEVLSDRAL